MPRLTIASFNVHWGYRPSRRERYDLADALRRIGTDVIVMQEFHRADAAECVTAPLLADGYQLAWLPLSRSVRERRARRVRFGGDGSWGLGVLTRCPIVAERPLAIGHAFLDPVGNRNALRVDIQTAGRRLPIVAVHTSSRVPWGPTMNLHSLRTQLPSLTEPAIVAGDCNFWGPAVVRLLPGWRRAVLGRTWPAHRPHSQIDHILVSRPVRVLHGEVLENFGSDHRPVRAAVAFG